MTDDALATVRTMIPIWVGVLVTFVAKGLGVELDSANAEVITSAGVALVYWAVAYLAQAHDIKFLRHLLPGSNPEYKQS